MNTTYVEITKPSTLTERSAGSNKGWYDEYLGRVFPVEQSEKYAKYWKVLEGCPEASHYTQYIDKRDCREVTVTVASVGPQE